MDGAFKVLRNASGKPIVKIDRRKFDLPEGWVDVEIDGKVHEANFVKEFVNVVREKGEDDNVLPEVMYRWFGDDAGKRGTAFGVSHAADEGGQARAGLGRRGARRRTQRRDAGIQGSADLKVILSERSSTRTPKRPCSSRTQPTTYIRATRAFDLHRQRR